MKKINYLLGIFWMILTLLTFHNSFSQVNQEWVARYNGLGDSSDYASSIAVDGSGNVHVTGYAYDNSTNYDYVTIKYNSSGVLQWVAGYNGPGDLNDRASIIAVDSSGNAYVSGFSTGNGTSHDIATIKYNSSGEEQWVARYNGPGNSDDEAFSIALDHKGNIYVTGLSNGIGTFNDYTTIKYNTHGIEQWVARYNGPGNADDHASSIAVDSSGNAYVSGYSVGSGTSYDFAIIKYSSSGIQQWVSRYNGLGNASDIAKSIAIDPLENVYVTGYNYISTLETDYLTVKYNSTGVLQWAKLYNGPANLYDYAYSIAVDSSGNVYVTGNSLGNDGGERDIATIKYNSEGVQQWVSRYNGPGSQLDGANSVVVDASGNIYVTGFSAGSETSLDYVTIKYNLNGDSVWVARYNGLGNSADGANSIILDGSGNVYVTGSSTGLETSYDYTTIKYSQSTGITQLSSEIPEQISLFQNYPNPFNPVTNLEFGISDMGFVSLKVYDLLGKEVAVLVKEKLSPGNYKVEFDGSGLTSGVYFYRLTAGEFTETKRMMLVK